MSDPVPYPVRQPPAYSEVTSGARDTAAPRRGSREEQRAGVVRPPLPRASSAVDSVAENINQKQGERGGGKPQKTHSQRRFWPFRSNGGGFGGSGGGGDGGGGGVSSFLDAVAEAEDTEGDTRSGGARGAGREGEGKGGSDPSRGSGGSVGGGRGPAGVAAAGASSTPVSQPHPRSVDRAPVRSPASVQGSRPPPPCYVERGSVADSAVPLPPERSHFR